MVKPIVHVVWLLTEFKVAPHCFCELVERQGDFPGDKVERGGHVSLRPMTVGFALHSREQAIESLHAGGLRILSPVGQDFFRMPFYHSGAIRAIGSSNSPVAF